MLVSLETASAPLFMTSMAAACDFGRGDDGNDDGGEGSSRGGAKAESPTMISYDAHKSCPFRFHIRLRGRVA